jgi:hypothetical protein
MTVPKLYVVVRGDLEPGLRAAQACHALRQFTADHPDADLEWFETSNTIVLLEVLDIDELSDLAFDLERQGARIAKFIEPDLGYELTAIAVAPEGRGRCGRLPLAFADAQEVAT